MLERSTNNIITTSIDQLSSLIKSATILGEPVIISQNEAIVPISKVSFGFGSGAADLITKLKENTSLIYEDQSTPCAGGLLGGVAVIPDGIIYLYQGNCQIIPIKKGISTYEKLADFIIEFISTFKVKKDIYKEGKK